MQGIRDFFRLRKQNDTVKIIGILFLLGVVCLIRVVYHAGQIYRFVMTPAEYILVGTQAVKEDKVRELEQTERVAAVSREMDIPISVKYKGKSVEVSCTLLSQSYVEDTYHIEVTGSGKVIYMNETAARSLWQDFSDQGMYISSQQNAVDTGYDIQYAEEGDNAWGIYKSAKLVVIEDFLHDTVPFLCMVEEGIRLSKEATELRILFKQHDLDGMQVNNLWNAGYIIENETVIRKEEYERNIHMLHMGYGLLICGVCTLSAALLWRSCKTLLNSDH